MSSSAREPARKPSLPAARYVFEERLLSPRHRAVGYLARLRKTCVSLALFTIALLGLLPLRAGEMGLAISVNEAQIKLPALSPALISIDLPVAEYKISPASLGYFSKQNEFVFTGDEQRGVIYGYDPMPSESGKLGRVWLVEVNTPQRAEEFLGDYLSEIRVRVDKLNTSENELVGARRNSAAKLSRAEQLADSILGQSSDDLAGGGLDNWASRVIAEGAKPGNTELLSALTEALSSRADARIAHKKMYYSTQEARLDLRLSTFELQLALARIPRPKQEGLIGLGDEDLVRSVLSEELERLRGNWDTRQQGLISGLSSQRKWLARLDNPNPSFSLAQPADVNKDSQLALAGLGAPTPLLDLKKSAVEARMTVDNAELEELSRVISELIQMEAYSKKDVSQTRDGLPRYGLTRNEFTAIKVDNLPQLSQIEAKVLGADSALPMLIQLAQIFEQQDGSARLALAAAGGGSSGVKPGGGAGIAPFPHETHYGLLVVDRCLREESARGLLSAAAPVNTPPAAGAPATLDSVLTAVLSSPGDYGVAAADPGYLKFMQWYAALLREKLPAPPQ